MALNWCMLSKNGQPVPLPEEKLFLSMSSVQLSLQPMLDSTRQDKTAPPTVSNVAGTAYITSQRFVFVSAVATPEGVSSGAIGEFRTLSVPLSHWQDGRLAQPLFSALYYEALVQPVTEGGLRTPQMAKIIFKEGRSWEFVTAIDEVKTRYDESRDASQRLTAGEDLPRYSPAPSTAAPLRQTAHSHAPDRDMLTAATVARDAEARERLTPSGSAEREPPPGYDI